MDVFRGQTGKARVIMRDVDGRVTDDWDVTGGINWSSSHPDAVEVVDEDLEPRDASFRFPALTPEGAEAFIEAQFDGRVGPETNAITLRSPGIRVLEPPPGEAVGGEVEITLEQVPA